MGLADWDFSLLEELIQDRGDVMTHETGMHCPKCQNNDPYASTVNVNGRPGYIRSFYCASCQGNGIVYRNARCIKGILTGIQPNQRDLIELGYVTPGDATFSPSLYAGYIGDFDRLTSTTTASVDSQVIVRGAANISENVALDTDLLPTQDRLWYLPDCVMWCEDEDGVVYAAGQDFTFADKKITWSNGPNTGKIYTIKYRAYIEWIVYSSPMERFDAGRSLAQRVMLRKKHIHMLSGSHAESANARKEEQFESTVNKPTKL